MNKKRKTNQKKSIQRIEREKKNFVRREFDACALGRVYSEELILDAPSSDFRVDFRSQFVLSY